MSILKLVTMFALSGSLYATAGCAMEAQGTASDGPKAVEHTTTQGNASPGAPVDLGEDRIEQVHVLVPGEPVPELTCGGGLIQCGYCEGHIFCTTYGICEKICGDRG